MLLPHEAESLIESIDNDTPFTSKDINSVQHLEGGYHANVDDKLRKSINQWLNSGAPLPGQNAMPVPAHPPGQMELTV